MNDSTNKNPGENLMKTGETFLSPQDVAIYLNVEISTVYTYLKDEKDPIPSIKINSKTIRVKESELFAWLERRRSINNGIL